MAAVVLFALGLPACGGGGSTTKTSTHATTTATTSTTAPAASGASVTSGPVHATFTAPNHAPTVSVGWPYSVHVTDSSGKPLSGTVAIAFTFGGTVVGHDTPRVHAVKDGHEKETLTFPKDAVGQPLSVQAVIHTAKGSVTLTWPIQVKQ